MNFTPGTKVTFKPTQSAEPVVGEYIGLVTYTNTFHVIQVPGFREPNWVRVGSEEELSIKVVETSVLDDIAEVWNNSNSTSQDIVNAVGKALQTAGYELRF